MVSDDYDDEHIDDTDICETCNMRHAGRCSDESPVF
jgi:hypothetical protein